MKYKGSLTESARYLLASGRSFKQATSDRSSSLDRLNRTYAVRSARPLFRTVGEEMRIQASPTVKALRKYDRAKTRRIRREFGHRTERAPDGSSLPDLAHIYLLKLKRSADVRAAAADFSSDPHVGYAHPNFRLRTQALPNDTYVDPDQDGTWSTGAWGQPYEDLWGLRKIGADQAWQDPGADQGDGTVVGVVDTGLRFNHPDIQGNAWQNPGEVAGNGLDDDQNGFTDDTRGWDFTGSNQDGQPRDGNGHGTHVSGTVAAVGNNGLGVIGVAPEAKVMPVKGLWNDGGGTGASLAGALRYAADNGADVINNSWGCFDPCPRAPVLEDAVRYAHGLGSVVVFAAGNANEDVYLYAPQNLSEAIVVSAFDQYDQRTSFTNTGQKVDVAAPGGGPDVGPPNYQPARNILSLRGPQSDSLTVGGEYYRQAGTSMAAPHVSGLAALILTKHPGFTNEDVRQVMRASADNVDAPGFDINSGRGRINAGRALGVDSPLRLQIDSPDSDTNFHGQESVEVTGTAAGAGFQGYELSYGKGVSPAEWTPIGSSSNEVTDGVLATWDLGGLDTDYYVLRLDATQQAGVEKLVYDTRVQVLKEAAEPLVTQRADQWLPAVSGDMVTWADGRAIFDPSLNLSNWWDIYLHDLSRAAETQVTDAVWEQMASAISGDTIVWEDARNEPGSHDPTNGAGAWWNWDIYLCEHSPATGTCREHQLTTDDSRQWDPDVSGHTVVWEGGGNDASDDPRQGIYLCRYDPASSECPERQITGDFRAVEPAISGNRLVWAQRPLLETGCIYFFEVCIPVPECVLDSDPSDCVAVAAIKLCDYDSATGACPERTLAEVVTNTNGLSAPAPELRWPRISGNRIVWIANAGGSWDVLYCEYDAATGNCPGRAISSDPADEIVPDVSDDKIVWQQGSQAADYDIYMYDLASETKRRVTANWTWQVAPAIDCDKIAWMDWRGLFDDQGTFTSDIYLSEIPGLNCPPSLRIVDPDVNDDQTVTGSDISLVAGSFGGEKPAYDLNADGHVSGGDIALSVMAFGLAWPPAVSEGGTLKFFVAATDPDGDELTFDVKDSPPGATFNPSTREFRWTPSGGQSGIYRVTFVAEDGNGFPEEDTNTRELPIAVASTSTQ